MEKKITFCLIVKPMDNTGMPRLQRTSIIENLDDAIREFKANVELGNRVSLEVMQ